MIGISYEGYLLTEEMHVGEILFAVTLLRDILKRQVLEDHYTIPVGLFLQEQLDNRESVLTRRLLALAAARF
jgi:hypothetical protein